MANAVEFTWEQKVYIVRSFAALRTVADILDTMQSVFGVRCQPDDLLRFDPNYRILPPDLHTVYRETSKAIADDPTQVIPLMSPVNQQIVLANAAGVELRRNALDKAAKLLEQLAKQQGGFFSAKATKSSDDPKAASTDVNDVNPKMTAEQAAEAYASTLND